MARRKASQGIQVLRDRTAGPKVVCTATVDQVYAQYQHETLYFRHPRGGGPKYLEVPMFEHHAAWIEDFARAMLNVRERTANRWGRIMGKNFREVVRKNAPEEFDDLRRSTGIKVKEGVRTIIDEPPEQRRLTDAELEQKDELREAMGRKGR